MKSALHKYQEYKNSGFTWLGNIPKHWEIERLKDISKLIIDGTHYTPDYTDDGVRFLSVNDVTRKPFDLSQSKFISRDAHRELIKRCHPKKGDILLSKNGTIGVPFLIDFEDEVSIYVSLCLIKLLPKINGRYSYYSFLASFMFEQYNLHSKMTSVTNLHLDKLRNFFQLSPPIDEQEAIASYLDTKTAQIDRKIDLLTQKAQRYEELKRAIVNETVTRRRRIDNGELIIDNGGSEIDNGELIMENDGGENCQLSTVNYPLYKAVNYPLYKDSGIDWIGEIPEHWQIRRIKDITVSDVSVKTPSQLKGTDLIEFLPMSNVNESIGAIKEFNFVELDSVSSGYTKFKNDDVIFAKITPCMENGNVALVKDLRYGIGFGSTEFMVFRSRKELLPQYLRYFFHNILFRKNAEPFMKGTAGQKRITSLYMSTHGFGLPPLSEQKAITEYLNRKTEYIDRIIENINTQVEIQKELRKTLINDVVTGKIKIIDNGE